VHPQRRLFVPLESTAETQPQLQPALLRLSAIISQYFTQRIVPLLVSIRQFTKISLAHEKRAGSKSGEFFTRITSVHAVRGAFLACPEKRLALQVAPTLWNSSSNVRRAVNTSPRRTPKSASRQRAQTAMLWSPFRTLLPYLRLFPAPPLPPLTSSFAGKVFMSISSRFHPSRQKSKTTRSS
jgi:hypothetical protein